jgi:hypothetical protein
MNVKMRILSGILYVIMIFFIVGVMCILAAASARDKKSQKEIPVPSTISILDTYIVEGCEYITLPGKYGFAHKGNCKNRIHIYRNL